MEFLYYLASSFMYQKENEKAKKLLPLTERICLCDQAEAEYLYDLREMLQ